jgi:hypothetical protein
MFFEIYNLAIVDFSLRIFNLSIADDIVLFPLASDHFTRRKNQRALTIKFIS